MTHLLYLIDKNERLDCKNVLDFLNLRDKYKDYLHQNHNLYVYVILYWLTIFNTNLRAEKPNNIFYCNLILIAIKLFVTYRSYNISKYIKIPLSATLTAT